MLLSYLTKIFSLLSEPVFRFKFADAGNMAPPLISFSEVAFSYSGKKKDYLFKDVSFGIHPSSRIVLVGPNGAGNYVARDTKQVVALYLFFFQESQLS